MRSAMASEFSGIWRPARGNSASMVDARRVNLHAYYDAGSEQTVLTLWRMLYFPSAEMRTIPLMSACRA